jgi:putative transcriptional regulator
MTITHHPQPESLMSCSAGSMPEAFAAVMSSHMTMCPACQKELALMEVIGVAMFDKLDVTPVLREAPVMAMRAGEADRGELDSGHLHAAVTAGGVPEPLVPVIGGDLEDITWKRLTPGVWQHQIALSDLARGELRLIKVAPGRSLPAHRHTGSELTLVLKGSYRDATGHYRPGDVADLSGDISHQPIADEVEGCICLIATEGRLKFKSMMARIVQPFAGI